MYKPGSTHRARIAPDINFVLPTPYFPAPFPAGSPNPQFLSNHAETAEKASSSHSQRARRGWIRLEEDPSFPPMWARRHQVILPSTHALNLWWPPIFLLEECQLVTDYSSPGALWHSNNTHFQPNRGAVASWLLWPKRTTSHTSFRSGTSHSSATHTVVRLAGCNPMTLLKAQV